MALAATVAAAGLLGTAPSRLAAANGAPLAFVANGGQAPEQVRHLAQGDGFAFFFTDAGVRMSFAEGRRGVALELRFVGANPHPRVVASKRGEGTVSYLGQASALAVHHVLTYEELWPGIDMAIDGQGGQLKYEFHVAPGADPNAIRLAYRGAEGLSLAGGGALSIATALGTLSDASPVSFQGDRRVKTHYRVDGNQYGFALPDGYDRSRPLVIDPELAYSTLLGGPQAETGSAIAVDGNGSAYVAGRTASATFPVTLGAFYVDHNGDQDVYVTKLAPDGRGIVWSTFIGGNGNDSATDVAVDPTGAVYVAGSTTSPEFPTTPGALDTQFDGTAEGFVAKLTPSGAAVLYSTLLPGANLDLEVDAHGSAFVTGATTAQPFPATSGAHDVTPNGGADAFVAKLAPDGRSLAYATLLGGAGDDLGRGLAIDGQGAAYVAGATRAQGFPTTPGAFDATSDGADPFVAKLSPSGAALEYSTFVGGELDDVIDAIAVDALGSAYVTGYTTSAHFPTTAGAFDTLPSGVEEAFVTKLSPSGGALAYSSLLGRSSFTLGHAIVVDPLGRASVAGRTGDGGVPVTTDMIDASYNGGDDAFVAMFNEAGTQLLRSTYLGGAGADVARGVALDEMTSLYVTGTTGSADFLTTPGAYASSHAGDGDAFVTKLDSVAGPTDPTGGDATDRTLDATVASILALELGSSTTFGQLTPGFDRDYHATIAGTATVTSDGALLTVRDPGMAPGHLVNGGSVLASAMEARASSLDGQVFPFAALGGAATTLVTYPDQTTGDALTLTFRQHVGARDKLRAGSYGKTLTFALSAIAP